MRSGVSTAGRRTASSERQPHSESTPRWVFHTRSRRPRAPGRAAVLTGRGRSSSSSGSCGSMTCRPSCTLCHDGAAVEQRPSFALPLGSSEASPAHPPTSPFFPYRASAPCRSYVERNALLLLLLLLLLVLLLLLLLLRCRAAATLATTTAPRRVLHYYSSFSTTTTSRLLLTHSLTPPLTRYPIE